MLTSETCSSKSTVAVSGMRPLVSVLVVEDDFGDYDAVARALRKMVHYEARCTRAKTLESARMLVSENRYDLFLVDYNLGVESGARFLQDIGGRSGRTPAVLLTGLLDGEVHEMALRAGAIGCMNKADLSPTLLETTIRSALHTHRLEADYFRHLEMLAHTRTSMQAAPQPSPA